MSGGGQVHGFLPTPVPEPAAWAMRLSGLAGLLATAEQLGLRRWAWPSALAACYSTRPNHQTLSAAAAMASKAPASASKPVISVSLVSTTRRLLKPW